MKIEIIAGDITKQPDVDAIVNSANKTLRYGSGTAGAIHTVAGPELEAYCRSFVPLALGDGIVTPGFNLGNQSIIHVRAASYVFDDNAELHLKNAIHSVIRLSEENHFERIAIPAIGTGVFHFPPELAAEIIIGTLMQSTCRFPNYVRICVFDKSIMQAFIDVSTGI